MSSKKDSIYLIGDAVEQLDEIELPTNKKVLSLFFYKRNILNTSIKQSITATVTEVVNCWNSSGRLVCRTDYAETKLARLHKEWKNVHKNRLRIHGKAQRLKEQVFKNKLHELFDISGSHVPAISAELPSDQQMPGPSSEIQHNLEEDIFQSYSQLSVSDQANSQSTNYPEHEIIRSISSFEFEKTYNLEITNSTEKNLITADLAAALDRTNTSSRSASFILTATIMSLGLNPEHFNLSRSAIHNRRIKFRVEREANLKKNIQIAKCLVVHWDGKILPELNGSQMVDRLPVIVSGLNTEQLLGVPKLDSGSGEDQATAIIETLDSWNCSREGYVLRYNKFKHRLVAITLNIQ